MGKFFRTIALLGLAFAGSYASATKPLVMSSKPKPQRSARMEGKPKRVIQFAATPTKMVNRHKPKGRFNQKHIQLPKHLRKGFFERMQMAYLESKKRTHSAAGLA